MNLRETKFVHAYLKHGVGVQAAQEAGYSPNNAKAAGTTACQLLKRPEIAAAIEQGRKDIAATAGITMAAVLNRMWQIATADANDLMQVRRVNCRHCWGHGFAYQWRPNEYLADCKRANDLGAEPPSFAGGLDFDENREPNPECPECNGVGLERVHVADTRRLKGGARLLYAGVEQTKHGIKVRTHDQRAALDSVARFIGGDIKKTEISGPDGKPLEVRDVKELSRAELLAIINSENESAD